MATARKYTEADFDRALERVATTITNVLLRHPGEPAYATLQGRSRRDQAFNVRFEEAKTRRQKLAGARRFNSRSDYLQILTLLEETPQTIASAARAVGPSKDAFLEWIKRRPALRARVDVAAKNFLNIQRLRAKVHVQSRPSGQLQAALSANLLYQEAARATPRNLDDIEDDVRSEIVLDLLEGRLTIDDLRSRSREAVGAALKRNRSLSYSQFVSLDDDVSMFDERMARVDTITTSEMIAF